MKRRTAMLEWLGKLLRVPCPSEFTPPGKQITYRCISVRGHMGMHGGGPGTAAWGDGAANTHHPHEAVIISTAALTQQLLAMQLHVRNMEHLVLVYGNTLPHAQTLHQLLSAGGHTPEMRQHMLELSSVWVAVSQHTMTCNSPETHQPEPANQ